MTIASLDRWISNPHVERFPYEEVMQVYQQVGKHFVSTSVLKRMDRCRSLMPKWHGPADSSQLLRRFLDTALDKFDKRYDYPTYLALDLLPIPSFQAPHGDGVSHRELRDRLTVQFVADVLRFELAAEGGTSPLPELRPERSTIVKRCRLGFRAAAPAARRLNLHPEDDDVSPLVAAERMCEMAEANMTAAERRAIRLSMFPVYVVHDEWLFIRVLQVFETTFALVAIELSAAISALESGQSGQAVHLIGNGVSALRESAPVFSMLATMNIEAFQTFRQYTDGASAIQSRGYKAVESLCRLPDLARMNSVAYHSVPEMREKILSGQKTISDTFDAVGDHLSIPEKKAFKEALRRFNTALTYWRQTHYRLALRMLGEKQMTNYTEGVSYLASTRRNQVFSQIPEKFDEEPDVST